MACNCIDEIKAKVKAEFGSDAYLETNHIISMNTHEPLGERPKPLVFRYPYEKKDGTYSERYKKANIGFIFCPFCGAPYRESENG